MNPITNVRVEYHRNGVSGWPFYAVLFNWIDSRGYGHNMVAAVFDVPEASGQAASALCRNDGVVAVLDVDKLAAGDIHLAGSRWRGDDFAPLLWEAIDRASGEGEDFG